MPSPQRNKIASDIQQKLARITKAGNLLPMPHNIANNKLSLTEWEEFHQRAALYRIKVPNWERQWGRPLPKTAETVWNLLQPFMWGHREIFDQIPMTHFSWLSVDEKQILEQIFKQALLIVLDAFVSAGQNHRHISYNTVFDALCRKYSDHHRHSLAQAVRDMRRETAWKCRRDLLLSGINVNKYWDIAVGEWSRVGSGLNPLFRVDKLLYSGRGQAIRVLLINSVHLDEFENILKYDPQYTRLHPSGIEALFEDVGLRFKRHKYEICAERPYNEVKLGEKSEELLRLQSRARLFLDVPTFKDDYEKERRNMKMLSRNLRDKYNIDPLLSSTKRWINKRGEKKEKIWSYLEQYVYYRSIEEGLAQKRYKTKITTDIQHELTRSQKKWEKHFDTYLKWHRKNRPEEGDFYTQLSIEDIIQAAIAAKEWRQRAMCLLSKYNRAQRHIHEYKTIYEQVRDKSDQLPIHSGFIRIINRRYQPLHFWPTYVTSKNSNIQEDGQDSRSNTSEDKHNSYRKRWFKARHPKINKAIDLVGFDISSSQTQIIATLLGIEKLERLTMEPSGKSFKETMAEWAWKKHEDPDDKFKLNQNLGIVPNYAGPTDKRLQELCKTLWMRVSYGSTVWSVVEDQKYAHETYGPGWTWLNAHRFLEYLYTEFPEVQIFLNACRRMAQLAYERDPYSGVELTDPFDGAIVRWNPVDREDVKVGNFGHKLIISLPRRVRKDDGLREAEPNINGDYPLDPERLRKMVAPCLIHMLDAYYSSLVMKRLTTLGLIDFVGIHDCWLVPSKVIVDKAVCNGYTVLQKVMKEAAIEWYKGLGPVYEGLLRYLASDREFGAFIKNSQMKWKRRIEKGYKPVFLAKPS